MRKARRSIWFSVGLVFLLSLGCLIFLPSGNAAPGAGPDLKGGPRGVVRSAAGFPIEGMLVQLISQKTSMRTTVYTNELGQYEFPKLEPGSYTLRTPRPLEFKRYLKESVRITGSDKFEDIVLDKVSNSEFLPPRPDIIAQLSDAEWLFNLDGTAQEKKIFANSCGTGCHTYQMQFRSRFDEKSWRLIVHRMLDYSGRILQGPGDGEVTPEEQAEREILVKWLARVRGPDAQDPPFKVFPRAHGPATRAVITEYELPWLGVHVHDVFGDTQSENIWFDINRSPFIGKLNPATGKVTSWRIPGTEGKHPGAHWIQAEKDGTVWYSETWSSSLIRFNPLTEMFKKMSSGVQGNMALAPDGTIWRTARGKVARFDRETAKIVETFPPDDRRVPSTYGNFVSWDGRYFGGGNRERDFDGVVFFDRQTKEVRMIPSPSGVSGASRGSFDPDGNIWVGGRGGVLVKYDHKQNVIAEYAPPTPWNTFYETRADKNGEVWAGEMRAGRIARFNPKTQRWIEYVLPEPFSFDWQTYVDNSTDPVTIWYGDQYGYIVRVQPLE
jgi:virginiamycin B lyase